MIEQQGSKCSACGDRIFSNFRHDFVRCKCGRTFVDGGFDYIRGGWTPPDAPPEVITRKLKHRPRGYFRGDERVRDPRV